jgi:hypothetical protein
MSWSLQISDGDLSFGGTGMNTVQGGAKLVQDLRACLLEPMGTDPLHPRSGSVIDGGVDANGRWQQGVIGGPNNDVASAFVSAEIQRIVKNYQASQVARNNADLATYGRSTLTSGEALLAVNNIDIQLLETAMQINVSLTTGTGSTGLTTLVSS